MKKYKVILTESEMRKLNEVRRNDGEFITVDYIDKSNYKKYVGRKVNVIGDVCIQSLGLEEIPITFGKVGGDFICASNNLTSLNGCPIKVGGYFDCSFNNISSLKGCPTEVGRGFDCSINRLVSLEGCPREVMGDFYCADNKLTSLEGCPRKVGQNFDCLRNKKKFTLSDVKRYCKVHGKICCD